MVVVEENKDVLPFAQPLFYPVSVFFNFFLRIGSGVSVAGTVSKWFE